MKMLKNPEKELFILLKSDKLTLSTAESCTGGLIAKIVTDLPGVSEVFSGSIVAYSNDVKVKLLNVSQNTLQNHGAVSEEVAIEMAAGIRNSLGTDVGISTTGIAGPTGGSLEKPVGTVCFAFALNGKTFSCTKIFKGSRRKIRKSSASFAIKKLVEYLKKE